MKRLVPAIACLALLAGCASTTSKTDNAKESVGEALRSGDAEQGTAGTETTAATTPTAVEPTTIYVSAPLSFPAGKPGEVSIVATGTPAVSVAGTRIPLVVRNNTSKTVYGVDINMTARGANGALVGSGQSAGGFQPEVLQPGEWAFGSVFFSVQLPEGATFETTVEGRSETIMDTVQLVVTEATAAQAPVLGGLEITVVVRNPSSRAIDLASGDVGCFTTDGVPLAKTSLANIDSTIPAGSSTSASASVLEGPCPIWAIGYSSIF